MAEESNGGTESARMIPRYCTPSRGVTLRAESTCDIYRAGSDARDLEAVLRMSVRSETRAAFDYRAITTFFLENENFPKKKV